MSGIELAKVFISVIPTLEGKSKFGKNVKQDIEQELVPATEQATEKASTKASDKGTLLGKRLGLKAAASFAALGLGAMLGQALAQGMDLEVANSKLTAQLDLTSQESAKAGKIAGDLWANAYGDSAADTSQAVGAVMSSIKGMRTAGEGDLKAMTAKTMSLASAFGMDVSEAAQAAGRMIDSGMAKDGTQAVDLLAASLTKVPAAMRGDIVDAANEYSGYLVDLGLAGEEAMGALVGASAGGTIAIDKTGDALKELSIRATDMSKASKDAYSAAGLDAEDMAKRFLAGGDTARGAMDDLVKGLQGIKDPTEQANAAIALFGTPLEDIGVAKIPAFLAGLSGMDTALGDTAGAAAKLDAQLNDNTTVSLEAVKRSFVQAFSVGVQPFLEAIKPVFDFLVEHPVLFQALAVGLAALAVGLGIAAAAQWVMNAALFASPITWIILGIVALIAALVWLVTNWEYCVGQAGILWGPVVEWFVDLWAAIATTTTETWNALLTWLDQLWNGFVAGVSGIWNAIATFFINLWNGIKTTTSNAWNALTGWLKNLWAGFVGGVAGIWNRLLGFFSGLWHGIKGTAVGIWNGLIGWLRNIPGRVFAGLAALAYLGPKAAVWFAKVLVAAKSKFGQVVSWVGGVPSKIMSALGSIGSLLTNSGRSLVDGFLRGIQGAWGRLTGWVSQGMARLRGLWPFSPAKWGPFSGKGYVTYSGEAITKDFAGALVKGQPEVEHAAASVMDAATIGVPPTPQIVPSTPQLPEVAASPMEIIFNVDLEHAKDVISLISAAKSLGVDLQALIPELAAEGAF